MTYTSTESHTLNTNVTTATHAGYVSFMRYLGLALVSATLATGAMTAVQPVDMDIAQPDRTSAAPTWNAVYAAEFPGCTDKGDFLPARIVVVPRNGEARTMPYTDATVASIDATWTTETTSDDLYTIGRCAR